VGGGIRDVETAIEWLDAGATQGHPGHRRDARDPEPAPRERVIAALDAHHNDIVVEGWTKSTGEKIEDRVDELKDLVAGSS
jgi:phosphoribosyl-ATP pyrophosphohydrolase/phosphoribosyl-AMP cyclohydrolase